MPKCPFHETEMLRSKWPVEAPGYWCRPENGKCSWRANADGSLFQPIPKAATASKAPPKAVPLPQTEISTQASPEDLKDRLLSAEACLEAACRLFQNKDADARYVLGVAVMFYEDFLARVIEGKPPIVTEPSKDIPF